MIFVGIDVAKDKHDCFILNSEGTVLADVFTIANNRIGFETLLSRIQSCSQGESKIKVGLEATGHYSYNLLGFLLDSGLATYVINPLHTNLYRKSLSLRRTKTDRIDARTIAMMLMSDVDLKSYSNTAYHNEELKSLTRYRFDKVEKFNSQMQQYFTFVFVHFITPQQGRQHPLFCWQPVITPILLHRLYHITPFSTIYLYFAFFIYPSCRNAQFPQALPKYDLA